MAIRHTINAWRSSVRGPPEGLCLTFANTKFWRGTTSPTEELHEPADFLAWCASAHVVDQHTLLRAREQWQCKSEEALTAFSEAIANRETIFRIFAAIAAGGAPAGEDLAAFNAALRVAPDRSHLHHSEEGYVWELPTRYPDLGILLAPVLWSAGDLLAGTRLPRVRQCANERCLWLFVDDSKNGSRRWCSMTACGNRAKAHRHYWKLKQGR
jgi:predicted RNA-binding Zn ribbon-like protein